MNFGFGFINSRVLVYIVIAVAAYLLGSIPTGYLAARAKGIDIRTVGSGNIGATNAFRILGKPAGIFVLVADGSRVMPRVPFSPIGLQLVAPHFSGVIFKWR